MKITLLSGPPGCQKTRTMLTEMMLAPGRYLVACERIDLIEEHARYIQDRAAELRISMPEVRLIHGQQRRRGDVRRQMADAVAELGASPHAAVFVTHEGLRLGDLSALRHWHARIDEQPQSVTSGQFEAGAAYRYLNDLYRLDPFIDGEWWIVAPKGPTLSMGEVMNDQIGPKLAPFHKEVTSGRGVFVNVGDWGDAKGSGTIRWWSLWTPLALEHFETVEIACANFESGLLYRAVDHLFPKRITYEDRLIGTDDRGGNPRVTINYFTAAHLGSTAFWSTSEGRWCLNQIARHMATVGGVDFWSGNEVVRCYLEHWFPGRMVLPKLAGTNSLIDHESCMIIYSNKAQEADHALIDVFALNHGEIKRAREIEDMIQFVTRGALRRPEFAGAYDIYVYDLEQAQALEGYLKGHAITDDVTLVPVVEAGIMQVQRHDGVSSRSGDAAAQAGRAEKKREDARTRQQRRRQKLKEAAAASTPAEDVSGYDPAKDGSGDSRHSGGGCG